LKSLTFTQWVWLYVNLYLVFRKRKKGNRSVKYQNEISVTGIGRSFAKRTEAISYGSMFHTVEILSYCLFLSDLKKKNRKRREK